MASWSPPPPKSCFCPPVPLPSPLPSSPQSFKRSFARRTCCTNSPSTFCDWRGRAAAAELCGSVILRALSWYGLLTCRRAIDLPFKLTRHYLAGPRWPRHLVLHPRSDDGLARSPRDWVVMTHRWTCPIAEGAGSRGPQKAPRRRCSPSCGAGSSPWATPLCCTGRLCKM